MFRVYAHNESYCEIFDIFETADEAEARCAELNAERDPSSGWFYRTDVASQELDAVEAEISAMAQAAGLDASIHTVAGDGGLSVMLDWPKDDDRRGDDPISVYVDWGWHDADVYAFRAWDTNWREIIGEAIDALKHGRR